MSQEDKQKALFPILAGNPVQVLDNTLGHLQYLLMQEEQIPHNFDVKLAAIERCHGKLMEFRKEVHELAKLFPGQVIEDRRH